MLALISARQFRRGQLRVNPGQHVAECARFLSSRRFSSRPAASIPASTRLAESFQGSSMPCSLSQVASYIFAVTLIERIQLTGRGGVFDGRVFEGPDRGVLFRRLESCWQRRRSAARNSASVAIRSVAARVAAAAGLLSS